MIVMCEEEPNAMNINWCGGGWGVDRVIIYCKIDYQGNSTSWSLGLTSVCSNYVGGWDETRHVGKAGEKVSTWLAGRSYEGRES